MNTRPNNEGKTRSRSSLRRLAAEITNGVATAALLTALVLPAVPPAAYAPTSPPTNYARASESPSPSSLETRNDSQAETEAPASDPFAPTSIASVASATTTIPAWLVKQREANALTRRAAAVETASTSADATASADVESASSTASGAGDSSGAVVAASTTKTVSSGGQTGLRGIWPGSAERLAAYLLAHNPKPGFSVPTVTLAAYYVTYAAEVGLRADILWAQMIHETGSGAYGGSVKPAQNNYAGIGATGGGVPGYAFATAEQGVKAHIAHMVAYVFETDRASWTNVEVDPRYDAVRPRGIAKVLADLDGRWAVPGIGYGAAIERHVAQINR
jgi:hypothetical protein